MHPGQATERPTRLSARQPDSPVEQSAAAPRPFAFCGVWRVHRTIVPAGTFGSEPIQITAQIPLGDRAGAVKTRLAQLGSETRMCV